MINSEDARRILAETGIKSRAVCRHTQLCDSYLSEWLNNRRILSQEQMMRLDAYFEKIKVIL